ncbi:MAG: DNA adenine methylase [Treponema sp.]|nr:DNA adenine methylase [Treponema sp.]
MEPENEAFLTRQLITYIGNKRTLLDFIGKGVQRVQKRLNKTKLSIFDSFSGSGITARYFKQYAEILLVNDLERYSTLINRCYLSNAGALNMGRLEEYYTGLLENLQEEKLKRGMIARLYAPEDDNHIKAGERVFYTVRNAMYIDTARQLIDGIPSDYQKYFLAPLLSEASIHANTSGVFKGFYKNKETGIGQFGGKQEDSLVRIKGGIALPFPVFSNYDCDVRVYNEDSNKLIGDLPEVDLAYFDPPYNQHPYGSNYFMLNLILDYTSPENPSRVSGIPGNWKRSGYNKTNYALPCLSELVSGVKAKYVLLSFNSDGFIGREEMEKMLGKIGKTETLEINYTAFRGGRNLKNRDIHVKEYLYLLEK